MMMLSLAERAETMRIRELVRNLPKGQSLDVQTPLTARQLPSRLQHLRDDAGCHLDFKCSAIPGGVRVTCVSRMKITGVHTVGQEE